MTLTTRVYTRGVRIDYDYNVTTGKHTVYFHGSPRLKGVRGTASEAFTALAPFIDNSDVRELLSWLQTL